MCDQSDLSDARDGLTHKERIVLWCLHKLQSERTTGPFPTSLLYGRVVEHIDLSVSEMQIILSRLVGEGLEL
ncbi:MAG: hypothetical protein O2860_11295 [Chloroflexi bacterium]|nr:hypothetical protein [Chloroflexota bacterium]